MNHESRAHAYLSCSSSDRWLACTVAPSLEANFSDESSVFAAEGTKAHELAEKALVAKVNASDVAGDYPAEMRDYVQMYLDYVRGVAVGARDVLIEQRLDISKWVPECFGTADAVVIHGETIHVIDLKYGKGLRVDAEKNSQLMLYALGAYEENNFIYGPFTKAVLHVVQPRLDHFDAWEIEL
jgi:hypothetical protein